MQFTFKNYEILNKRDALRGLVQIDLPVKTSWNIGKNIKKFDAALKAYAEFESGLVDKYALKDENGNVRFDQNNQPKFGVGNRDKFNKEQTELLNCEETLDLLTINLSDLIGNNIKPALLLDLEFMIVDDTE